MNYKAGDSVVCIDTMLPPGFTWSGRFARLTLGATYTVTAVGECTRLVERPYHDTDDCCNFCGSNDPFVHYEPWRFIKLDPLEKESATTKEKELT